MKKIVAFFLVLSLAVSGIMGCGNVNTKSEEPTGITSDENTSDGIEQENVSEVELTFSAWAGATEKEILEQSIAAFTEATGIKVKGVFIPDDYETKISTMIASGTAPDVGYLVAPTAHDWFADGQILDLVPLIEEDTSFKKEDLLDVAYSYYDEKSIDALLLSLQAYVVFYNKDLFEKAGVPEPSVEDVWTWDEFVETARKLTLDANGNSAEDPEFDAENIQQYGIYINPTSTTVVEPLLARNTPSGYTNSDGTEYGLKDPEEVEFLQKLADLINVEKINPSPTSAQGLPSADLSLQTGKYAMVVESQYMLSNFAKLDNLNLGIAALPSNGNNTVLTSSGCKVIFSQTKHPKEAWELMKWLSNPEQSLELYSSGLWMPIMSEWYTDESKIEQWAGISKAHPEGYREVLLNPVWENSQLSSEHRMKHYNQINDIVFPALDKVWAGEQTAKDVLNEVMPEVDKIFEGVYE
ncbi:MAG TPA: sugar ABC transporter substrate-binding protein [Candidatus Eisenbergiella intestinipullorum]|nr:sugar ABC transporter substrate-binding protein [Candidatus Eisenbergiella intestinipullorum]